MGIMTVTPTPQSVARIQAINSYPAQMSLLNLYPEYDRPGYFAAFGIQAPDEDPTKPYKLWFATDSPASVNQWVKDPNTGAISFQPIPGSFDPAAVNIPGFRSFPAYVNPPTSPAVQIFQSQILQVSGSNLILQADAQQIATEVGGTLAGFGPQTYVWNGEQRRPWQIAIGEGQCSAAQLAAQRWANGVGSPGKWDFTNPNNPTWIPAPARIPGTNTAPHVPVPQRGLHLGEQISVEFPGIMVVTLVQQAQANADPTLAAILAGVNSILEKLSGGA